MLEGMRADFNEGRSLSVKVWEIATRRRTRCAPRTAAGTDIVADMNPNYKWLKTSGIISQNKWGNLPGGEIFTTPGEVNGMFVIDGVVGDYLCAKYGDLRATPLTIRVKSNRLTEAHCANRELEDEFWRYTHTDENSDRVGEFAIGTNIGLHDVIGNILQDEKIPGVHIAFGNPYGAHTGADWDCSTHIDVVGTQFDIWADDRQIMRAGEFLDLDDSRTAPPVQRRSRRNITSASLTMLDDGCGTHVKFRNCETPCFFPRSLIDRMEHDGRELIHQLMTPEYLKRSDETIPAEYLVPNQDAAPSVHSGGFRIDRIAGTRSWSRFRPSLRSTPISRSSSAPIATPTIWISRSIRPFDAEFRRAVLGDHDPENVVLLEIDPQHQKTLPDFLLTEKLLGIKTVCITEVEKRGNRLFHDGVPIERIYNRVIVDELQRKQIRLPFDFRDDLEVEWAGHPNWYFRISKFSLPFLASPFRSANPVSERRRARRPRKLGSEAALLVRRTGRRHRPDARRYRRASPTRTIHPAGARQFRAAHRNSARRHQSRNPDDVYLAGRSPLRDDDHPHGPRQNDGRRSQPRPGMGRRLLRLRRLR